jgi:Kef-type K+ transport system membrane component KefB
VLMNARGLVELIVLSVGLDRRVITPTLYSVLVLMTAVTTLIPSPVLMLLYGGSGGAHSSDLAGARGGARTPTDQAEERPA